jgi:hypothetical protein
VLFRSEGIVDYQNWNSTGRLDKLFSRVGLRGLVKPIRKFYLSLLRFLNLFTTSQKIDKSSDAASIRINKELIQIVSQNPQTGILYGEIWPGIIGQVAEELAEFFTNSTLENPFELTTSGEYYLAIHYRLGDMRVDSFWAESHGVLDPITIFEEVKKIRNLSHHNFSVFVYSDEPKVAKRLLESVGLYGCTYIEPSDIWADIKGMSNSTHFIGSFSTVSAVVAEIRTFHKLPANNLPFNCRRHRVVQTLENSNYFEAKMLPLSDPIYKVSAKSL